MTRLSRHWAWPIVESPSRDETCPCGAGRAYAECRKRSADGTRRYRAAERPVREAQRAAGRTAAATQIGELTDRELLIAGALATGAKGTRTSRADAATAWSSSIAIRP